MSRLRVGLVAWLPDEGRKIAPAGKDRRERGRNGRKRCSCAGEGSSNQAGQAENVEGTNVQVLSVLLRSAQGTARVGQVGGGAFEIDRRAWEK